MHLQGLVRSTILGLIVFSASALATPIYEYDNKVAFSCSGGITSCSSGAGSGTALAGLTFGA